MVPGGNSVNYEDHHWTDATAPEKASARKGEEDVEKVVAYLRRQIENAVQARGVR